MLSDEEAGGEIDQVQSKLLLKQARKEGKTHIYFYISISFRHKNGCPELIRKLHLVTLGFLWQNARNL